jgi:hypothetical protein
MPLEQERRELLHLSLLVSVLSVLEERFDVCNYPICCFILLGPPTYPLSLCLMHCLQQDIMVLGNKNGNLFNYFVRVATSSEEQQS